MDLKIGSSSMGATKAGVSKKVKQSVVKALSTSSTLGFRVAGMVGDTNFFLLLFFIFNCYNLHRKVSKSNFFLFFVLKFVKKVYVNDHDETKGKNYGLSLNKNTIHTAFVEFLSPKNVLRLDLLEQLKQQLCSIRDFFNQQQYLSFNSSSLLILYEGDSLIVRLIDFAHCYPLSGGQNSEIGFVFCSSLISDAVPPISVARPVHASLGGTKTTLAVPSAFQKKNSLSSSQLPKSKSSSLLKLSGGVDKVIGDATPRLDGNYLKGLDSLIDIMNVLQQRK
jgi:hypothetical protein